MLKKHEVPHDFATRLRCKAKAIDYHCMCKHMLVLQLLSHRYSFNHIDEDGNARIEDVVQEFATFYEKRIEMGLHAEKKPCIFTKGAYTDKEVERLILSMPFKRFEDMHFIHHAKHPGIIQLDHAIVRRLNRSDIQDMQEKCSISLNKYFGEI